MPEIGTVTAGSFTSSATMVKAIGLTAGPMLALRTVSRGVTQYTKMTAWQEAFRKGPETLYGKRTVKAYVQRLAFELYDLVNDPHEVKNLAADAKFADVLKKMQDELKEFQKRTRDPWLLKWERE